jgi:hypothetical protein
MADSGLPSGFVTANAVPKFHHSDVMTFANPRDHFANLHELVRN